MDYTILGRTGLRVSVAGLGCGGPSRLGLRDGAQDEEAAVALVQEAIDLGVNFLDTAQTYGTEAIVGKAIKGLARDNLVISTKKTLPAHDHPDPDGEIRRGLEQSLKAIGTDYIDVYHLHGVEPKDLDFAINRLMPTMLQLKAAGKIRFIGVTEAFPQDPSHTMFQQSVPNDYWDVIMVGLNLLNASAAKNILPSTQRNGVGVLGMFAVRRALSRPERLKNLIGELLDKHVIKSDGIDRNHPLNFVLRDSDAATIPEAAYRFCRHTPGVDVVLTGTGSREHLKANLNAILKPPLPRNVLNRLDQLFGKLDNLTAN